MIAKDGALKPASGTYAHKWYANGVSPPATAVAAAPALVPASSAAVASAPAPASSAKKRKADDSDEEDEPPAKSTKVKLLKKGRAAVDGHCKLTKTAHVYEQGADVWDCMLNQTNIGANNNKFYVIQLLESDDKKQWYTWNRWGRVGATGQSKLQEFNSLDGARNDFCKKFADKSGNDWTKRSSFQSKPGKYTLIEIDYGSDASAEEDEEAKVCAFPRVYDRGDVLYGTFCIYVLLLHRRRRSPRRSRSSARFPTRSWPSRCRTSSS